MFKRKAKVIYNELGSFWPGEKNVCSFVYLLYDKLNKLHCTEDNQFTENKITNAD